VRGVHLLLGGAAALDLDDAAVELGAEAGVAGEVSRDQATPSRTSSFSNSRRSRSASLSGSQLAICGKMVR